MERRRFIQLLAIGTSPLLAGCSTNVSGTETTPSSTMTVSPTATPRSAQVAYSNYEWSKLSDVEPTPVSTIEMINTAFDPLIVAVNPGTSVTVINRDPGDHTMTVPRLGINETLENGASFSFSVETTGTFDYVCTLHPPGMLGRLIVTDNPPTVTSTETVTETTTETPTETATPTETTTPTPTETGSGSSATVTVGDNYFSPERTEIDSGGTIEWEALANNYGNHTVTATQFHDDAAAWSKDTTLAPGDSTTRTFESAGIYEYYCSIHGESSMCGVILVGDVTLSKDLPCE